MFLDEHLIQLFENLPCLPMTEIVKHLDDCDLVKLGLLSGNWNRIISPYMKKRDATMLMSFLTNNDSAEILIQKRRVGFSEKLSIKVEVKPGLSGSSMFSSGRRFIICHLENLQRLQQKVIEITDQIGSVMTVTHLKVHINFDFGYSLKFLKSLCMKEVVHMVLEAEKARVNSSELMRLLESTKVSERLELKVKTCRNMAGQLENFTRSVHLCDSRWITGDYLIRNLNNSIATFENCRLTAQDFNAFLIEWKKLRKEKARCLEFQLMNKLCSEDIVKNLQAKPWDPTVRSRKIYHAPTYESPLRIFDLSGGLDITNNIGDLGTIEILSEGNILRFHVWKEGQFPLQDLKELLEENLERAPDIFEVDDLEKDEMQFYKQRMQTLAMEIKLLSDALEDN